MKRKLPASPLLPVPPLAGTPLPVALVDPEALVDAGRPSLPVHRGRITEASDALGAAGTWPLHSPGTLATSLLVATVAVGWLVTVVALTAPTMAAGELLARAARLSEGA
jgi:hypothetical protein